MSKKRKKMDFSKLSKNVDFHKALEEKEVLYGIIVLYVISILTDKVILGISQSKAFYVVTDKEQEVTNFLLSLTGGGVTKINARGGYTNDKQTLLLCVMPTKQYFIVKEGLKEIDNNIFFLVTDAYEVSNKGV